MPACAAAGGGDKVRAAGCDGAVAKPCLPAEVVREAAQELDTDLTLSGHAIGRKGGLHYRDEGDVLLVQNWGEYACSDPLS